MSGTADDERIKAAGATLRRTGAGARQDDQVRVELKPMPAEIGAPPEEGIGERLRYARSQLALSTEGLSRLTRSYDSHDSKGISGTSIARYESGASQPAARELRLLCEALDVPVAWLLLGVVPNGGKTAAAQALVAALAGFVRETNEDVNLGGETSSAFLARSDSDVRARRLAQARKPEANTQQSA